MKGTSKLSTERNAFVGLFTLFLLGHTGQLLGEKMLQIPLPKAMTGIPKVYRRREVNKRGPVITRAITIRCWLCKQQGNN